VQTIFAFTPQAEIRPAPYVDYVRFLKEVYAPNCTRRAIELRKIAQERFQGKRRTIPSLHLDKRKDREPIAYISISRYRSSGSRRVSGIRPVGSQCPIC
jgi:hypothetical protein